MKKTIIPLLLLSGTLALPANVPADTTTVQEVMQYADYNYLHNVEHGSLNPASISAIPMNQLATASVGYFWENGQYHNIDKAKRVNGLRVDTYGFKHTGRLTFEGGISYSNINEKARCWNSTLYLNSLNPFILADSVPSDYNSEIFDVTGRVAYRLNDRLRLGLNAVYHVGVASDEQDPRVETKGMRFIINPGIEYDLLPSLSIGATGGLNLMSESLRYTSLIAAQTYDFFLMNGLGTFYPIVRNAYQRDYDGTSWFAGGSLRFTGKSGLSDYLTVTYGHDFEKAKDGGSTYRFLGGDYNNDHVTVTNRLSILTTGLAHNVTAEYRHDDVHGVWHDQISDTENGTTIWHVVNSAVCHREFRHTWSVGYRADWLDANGVPSITAGIKGGAVHSSATSYPDLYRRKFTTLNVDALVKTYFNFGRLRLGVGMTYTGKFDKSPSDGADFRGQELENTYSLPMYAYLASSSYNFSGNIDLKFPIASYVIGAWVTGGSTRCTSGALGLKGKHYTSIDCGLSLAF